MLDVKALLAKMLTMLAPRSISYQLANSNVETFLGGNACVIPLPYGYYIAFWGYVFKTSSTRTDLGAFRLHDNGYVLEFVTPYWFIGTVSGSYRNCYGNTSGYWMNASGAWNANTEFRIEGVGLMKKTSTHI